MRTERAGLANMGHRYLNGGLAIPASSIMEIRGTEGTGMLSGLIKILSTKLAAVTPARWIRKQEPYGLPNGNGEGGLAMSDPEFSYYLDLEDKRLIESLQLTFFSIEEAAELYRYVKLRAGRYVARDLITDILGITDRYSSSRLSEVTNKYLSRIDGLEDDVERLQSDLDSLTIEQNELEACWYGRAST